MNSKSMAGWIGFAGIVMVIIGGIDFFQGLIALLEDEYYVPTGSGFLVFDLTGWGWVMLIWGVLLFFAGVGLIAGQGWARWFAIVVVALNFIAQLGFLGNTQYPLWSLTVIALNIIVLYALTARGARARPISTPSASELPWIEAAARSRARRPPSLERTRTAAAFDPRPGSTANRTAQADAVSLASYA